MTTLTRNIVQTLAITLGALLFAGCAGFSTVQTDTSHDPITGFPVRSITTKATSRTLFESKSALSQFEASQTDKTQSAKVGGLSQQAASPVKDMVELLKEVNSLKSP